MGAPERAARACSRKRAGVTETGAGAGSTPRGLSARRPRARPASSRGGWRRKRRRDGRRLDAATAGHGRSPGPPRPVTSTRQGVGHVLGMASCRRWIRGTSRSTPTGGFTLTDAGLAAVGGSRGAQPPERLAVPRQRRTRPFGRGPTKMERRGEAYVRHRYRKSRHRSRGRTRSGPAGRRIGRDVTSAGSSGSSRHRSSRRRHRCRRPRRCQPSCPVRVSGQSDRRPRTGLRTGARGSHPPECACSGATVPPESSTMPLRSQPRVGSRHC